MANDFNSIWLGRLKYVYELATGVVRLPAGLAFPSTQVASSDANTLDDYEEGTFTPTIGDGTNNYTTSIASGVYTKIGSVVTAQGILTWTSIGSAGASQLRISGLPFAAKNVSDIRACASFGIVNGVDTAGTRPLVGYMNPNTSALFFRTLVDNGASANVAANASSATGDVTFSITYITD